MDELDLSEEEMKALVELGVIPEELAENRRQTDLAEALRHGAGPEGRQAGRVYVAANPLEHLQKGIERYKGAQDMKRLGGERQGLMDKVRTGRSMYGDLLRGRGQMSPVGAAPMGAPSVTPPRSLNIPSVPPIGPPQSPMAGALRGPAPPAAPPQMPGVLSGNSGMPLGAPRGPAKTAGPMYALPFGMEGPNPVHQDKGDLAMIQAMRRMRGPGV